MKVRVVYMEGPLWENIDPEEIEKVVLTPFAYFNIFMKDGRSFSCDKMDATK